MAKNDKTSKTARVMNLLSKKTDPVAEPAQEPAPAPAVPPSLFLHQHLHHIDVAGILRLQELVGGLLRGRLLHRGGLDGSVQGGP